MAEKLAIVAGAGAMPVRIAEAALARGHDVYVFAITGEAGADIEVYPHSWIKLVQLGRFLRTMKEEQCSKVLFIGRVSRPDLANITFDLGAIRNMPAILGMLSGGDDSILSNAVAFFEEKGISVLGIADVAPELLAPAGRLGKCEPSEADLEDTALAWRLVEALGHFDVGQGAVAVRGQVLATEAAEGTDAMLARCKPLRPWGLKRRVGVFVKRTKPEQERRMDLPTVGPETIRQVAAAGLAGLAIEAGGVLIMNQEECAAIADREGLFFISLQPDGSYEKS